MNVRLPLTRLADKLAKYRHTPGPWMVVLNEAGAPSHIEAPRASDQQPGAVGTKIIRQGSLVLPSSAEGQANARLIAAAPDMLDGIMGGAQISLPDLLDYLAENNGESQSAEFVLALRQRAGLMRAVLRKVEGL